MKSIAIFANLALMAFTIFLYFDMTTISTKESFAMATFILVPFISLIVILASDKKRK
ncbi:hypothetical protein [Sulfurovum sp.]|uniref:hypothetical protein n=1 Tax=Sulfurovum sp. TaxID=1969726 RepID=UPI002867D772|nr:hypothetical protein [Sulfurovum sp.]